MTRGRCGSLLLHRDGLAPSTPCRSPGALRFHEIAHGAAPISRCRSMTDSGYRRSDISHKLARYVRFPFMATKDWASQEVLSVPAADSCSAATRVVIRSPLGAREHLRGERYCIWDSDLAGFGCGRRRAARRRSRTVQTSQGGVRLGLNSIVIKSHEGSTLRVSQTPSISVTNWRRVALQSKQTIACAARRCGHERRTLWRGVTTRLGHP